LLGPAAATAGLTVPLLLLERRMRETGGPGIIPFELAGPERSAEILRRWGADGQRAARASLLLDFPYLVAYTTLNVRLASRARNAAPFPHLGRAVAAVQVAAGACDAVENAALLGVVGRGGDPRLASLARTAARAKFAGLIVGWLYGAAALLAATSGAVSRPSAP
jgi:hypothetical protein